MIMYLALIVIFLAFLIGLMGFELNRRDKLLKNAIAYFHSVGIKVKGY